jgi:hypothetical protein
MAYSNGIEWNKEKIERVKNLTIKGYSGSETANLLSAEFDETVTTAAVNGIKSRHGILNSLILKDNSIKVYDGYLQLPDDKTYTIVCDIHSPYHHTEWVNRAILISSIFNSKNLVIAGDLFDMNFAKHWPKQEGEQGTSLDDEIEQVGQIICFLDYFDMIYLIRGNHEDRPTRKTEALIQARYIIKLMTEKVYDKKFIYSYYDRAYIGNDWMVIHPKSYSQISASTGVRLVEKYRRNVMNAHGHFQAFRYDRSGKNIAIDLGCLLDPMRIGYKNLSTTTHPEWNNGFAVLKNNHIHLFGAYTDWESKER